MGKIAYFLTLGLTAQNGTGEPHLGTIPTMKVLVP